MTSNIIWFTAIIGYIVQTKSFSRILARHEYGKDYITNNNHTNTNNINNNASNGDPSNKVTKNLAVHVAILYFISWFLLLPLSRYWNYLYKSSSSAVAGTGLNNNVVNNSSLSSSFSSTQSSILLTTNNNNLSSNSSNLNLVCDDNEDDSSKLNKFLNNFKHFIKIFILAILLDIAILSYTVALSMMPAFDVTLIQNTSIFEITTLLYGVCNVAKRQNVFRNFVIMMTALVGILIISYTNATCDLLEGKLSINKETGEVNDPFLFDRLKASLLCGLCSLVMGPFAVLANKWLTEQKPDTNKKNISYLITICVILLLPLLPNDTSFFKEINDNNNNAWFFLFLGIIGGVIPTLVSIILLNKNSPPEFLTTANLAVIVMMGIANWISEANQTYIIRWEVIGYIMLSISTLFLFFSLRGPSKERI